MSIPEAASEYLKNNAYLAKWDGQGLPPVGAEVEAFNSVTDRWYPVRIVYSSGRNSAWIELDSNGNIDSSSSSLMRFRPIRSEADKKRDEVTQSILDILNDYDFELVHIRSDQKRIATDIVERIASGMIPHIRID